MSGVVVATYKHRELWLLGVMADAELADSAKVGAVVLGSHLNFETLRLDPSIGRLSNMAALPRRTIDRALNALVKRGHIRRSRRGKTSNSYELLVALGCATGGVSENLDAPLRVLDAPLVTSRCATGGVSENLDAPLRVLDAPLVTSRCATGGAQTLEEPKGTYLTEAAALDVIRKAVGESAWKSAFEGMRFEHPKTLVFQFEFRKNQALDQHGPMLQEKLGQFTAIVRRVAA
jgi:hypothetical protein